MSIEYIEAKIEKLEKEIDSSEPGFNNEDKIKELNFLLDLGIDWLLEKRISKELSSI